MQLLKGLALLGLLPCLLSCAGAADDCKTVSVMSVSPQAGVADHGAVAPNNQQQFQASVGARVVGTGTGCALPAILQLVHPAWTNPDPDHLTISSADDATNGLAVCTGTTAGTVTLTATLPTGTSVFGSNLAAPLTATATLTCK